MKPSSAIRHFAPLCLLPLLQSCGGGADIATFVISGTVSGLTTGGLSLSIGQEVITVNPGASTFAFQGRVSQGGAFTVSVRTQPTERDETCVITGGTGVANGPPIVSVSCHATQWTVTTVAGSGQLGALDGPPAAAAFRQPAGVAVAADGTLYVADSGSNKIRKIAGVVSTLSGSGATAYAEGPGTTAAFNVPQGVAVDGMGNVFVADGTNCMVRMIRPDGFTSTLAGRYLGCFQVPPADGAAGTATFGNPVALALAPDSSLYVADTPNWAIRRVTQAGSVSSLWPFQSVFVLPQSVAVDSAGTVYFPDSNGNKIYRVSSGGVLGVLAGSGAPGTQDGQGIVATFTSPTSIAVDAGGTVFVGDGSHLIRKITASGKVTTIAGQSSVCGFADGVGSVALFCVAESLAVDWAGSIYVADLLNNRIRKISGL
jgi:sugar lactone lactonase YvrE